MLRRKSAEGETQRTNGKLSEYNVVSEQPEDTGGVEQVSSEVAVPEADAGCQATGDSSMPRVTTCPDDLFESDVTLTSSVVDTLQRTPQMRTHGAAAPGSAKRRTCERKSGNKNRHSDVVSSSSPVIKLASFLRGGEGRSGKGADPSAVAGSVESRGVIGKKGGKTFVNTCNPQPSRVVGLGWLFTTDSDSQTSGMYYYEPTSYTTNQY